MSSRKTTAVTTSASALAILGALTGCGTGDATAHSTSRTFPFTADVLTIDASETTLRVVTGPEGSLGVDRTLEGSAANGGGSELSLDGSTLRVAVTCEGLVLRCSGEHTVSVPDGTSLRLTVAGSPVVVGSVTGDIVASVTDDGSLRISEPAGALDLSTVGGSITVTGATSTAVRARTSADGDIELDFASPPDRVDADASGSVRVTVPADPQGYRVVGADAGDVLSDDTSDRTITVSALDGSAVVQQRG